MENDTERENAELRARVAALEGRIAPKAEKKRTSVWAWLGVLAGGFLLLAVIGSLTDGADTPIPAPASSDDAAAAAPVTPAKVWQVSEIRDPMVAGRGVAACTTSTNEIRLDWPYHNVDGRLCVRRLPTGDLDVYVALNGDGQILCSSYEGCTAHIRFDEGKAQSFTMAEAADHSTNIIFVANATRMIGALKGAKVTRVELNFYQAGQQAFEFPTAGFVWPPAAPTPDPA